MTRNRLLLAMVAGISLCLAGGSATALTIDPSGTTDTTSDDGPTAGASAGSTVDGGSIGSDTIADLVGEIASVTPRVRGHAADVDSQGIVQTIDVSFVYEITAPNDVVYDITFSPEFHGILKIADNLADESGDGASFQALKAELNGSFIADLDLGSFTSRTTDGFTTADFVATGHTISGASGNNTFTLDYSVNLADNPILFEALSAGETGNVNFGDCTQAGAMWGQDSPLSPSSCSGSADFLDYNSAANRAADGLFGAATVEITAVPEPGTLLLVGSGLAGLAVVGRRRD